VNNETALFLQVLHGSGAHTLTIHTAAAIASLIVSWIPPRILTTQPVAVCVMC